MENVAELLIYYFRADGMGWALLGATIAAALGAMGSGRGIHISSVQAAGALSEAPELFGKLLVIMALPGTQGFYSFTFALLILARIGLFVGIQPLEPLKGFGIFAAGISMGLVQLLTGIWQGKTSAACVNFVAKQPESSGRAILLPALVETYAVLGFLAGLIVILQLT